MEQNLEVLVKALTGFGSQQMSDVGVTGFVFVMTVSLVCSIFIAYLYRHFYSGRSTGSEIHRAFPLLGISVTSIFITIQFSLPLSLGLLGALSIVRFRTPIKEPEEIGFIMLVIATSISCATFNFVFLGIVMIVAIVALVFLSSGALYLRQNEGVIVITMQLDEHQAQYSKLIQYLEEAIKGGRVDSIAKTDTASVISYAFRNLENTSLEELQTELDGIVGRSGYSIFLNQARVI